MASNLKGKLAAVLLAAVAIVVPLLGNLEGNPGKPYVDIAGVLTDCYGNTKNVSASFIRSPAECKALLGGEALRIGTFVQADVPGLNKNELASIVSFTYNVGDYAYRQSTLRTMFKEGRNGAGCLEMHRWNKITKGKRKVVAKGLTNRRIVEVELCMKGTGNVVN